jgi:hypothetical protein
MSVSQRNSSVMSLKLLRETEVMETRPLVVASRFSSTSVTRLSTSRGPAPSNSVRTVRVG